MKKPKVIAHYLPQFHPIPENDAWWGKDFTEWTAAKAAKPIFEGHHQPRIPLNDNYYNLLDYETMEWQASLASQYGVDCFSIYHYWFANGKYILEKPVENLLQWKNIDIQYCFNWANESWIRSWSKLNIKENNVWADLFDTEAKEGDDGLLMEQKYGCWDDWLKHIHYLIPFFQDKRYLKKDGKPVFIIYRPNQMKCLCDMKECWEKELKKAGFPGIYIIAEITSMCKPIYDADAFLVRNPNYCYLLYHAKELSTGFKLNDYDAFWQALISIPWEKMSNRDIYLCGCVDFDNTPRRGEKGWAFEGVTAKKFEKYFGQLYQKAAKQDHDFVFLNAWNEWGEGMYLEPDTQNGYAYLEAVRRVINDEFNNNTYGEYSDMIMEHLLLENTSLNKYYYISKETQEFYEAWLQLKQKKKSIYRYLDKLGIKKVAVYGIGNVGRHLLEELLDSDIIVTCVIDNNVSGVINGIKIQKPKEKLENTDIIICTVIGRYDAIKNAIQEWTDIRTISLEHIISELL